jgi:hypothetical protein
VADSLRIASFLISPARAVFGEGDGAQGIISLCRGCAHEVALADLDAALPDDVVGGRGVKPEIGQTVAKQ